MKDYKLVKLLAKLEREYEQVPKEQAIKRNRIMQKYERLYKKYTYIHGDFYDTRERS